MNILLLGDSIRMHAQPFVADYLAGFSVSGPTDNCQCSSTLRTNLNNWIGDNQYDVIHVNCGLHDVRYNPDCKTPVNNRHQYQDNLQAIFQNLATLNTPIIWATSTPFNETIHNRAKSSRRYLADIQSYNALSKALAKSYGFVVNDVYEMIASTELDALLIDDGLHFNETGNQIIAQQIAQAIVRATQSSATIEEAAQI